MDMPEVRAADAALDRLAMTRNPAQETSTSIQARLRILSIVRPVADLSPSPILSDNTIRELVWKSDPLDQAGLSQALALKTGNPAQVTLDVLMVGGAAHEDLLRAKAGAKADRLIRLNEEKTSPAVLADAVRTLELLNPYDLVIMGSECLNGDQGTGAYLAGSLRRTLYRKELVQVRHDGLGIERVAPPAVMCITAAVPETLMDMTTAVRSISTPVLILEPPRKTISAANYAKPAPAKVTAQIIASAIDAAEYLKRYAATAGSVHVEDYTAEVGLGRLPDHNTVWAVLDPSEHKVNKAVLQAARQIADLLARPMSALIPAPKDAWPALLGAALANGTNQAFCMNTGTGMLSVEGKREALRLIVKTTDAPLVVANSYWTDAFGFISGEASQALKKIRLFGDIVEISAIGKSSLILSQPAYDGRLIRKETMTEGRAFITVAHEAEFPSTSLQSGFTASALDSAPGLEWIMPLPPGTGQSLAQAEVIIDLGYGIKDQTGLTLARELAKKLEALGLAPMFGATRKVTQDLKLQPLEAQIGQTGVRVNPKLIIALGISGAPQHIDYLGTRAEVLCFNKDADAPLMKLNQSRPAPRVHPIEGDLFVTVRQLISLLSHK
jgi:electron transfer flavoprotein alpha subunit